MKKMMIALGLMAMTLVSTAMTNGKEIDKHIQQAFDKEFVGAIDVKWYITDKYAEVDFTFNNMRLRAYYNNDGEILAVVRNVSFSSLPLSLQLDLKKQYKDYWITNICEVTDHDGTRYRATIENSERVVQLGSNGNYSWELIKREVK